MPVTDAGPAFDERLQAIPEFHAFKQRIYEVGDRAIVSVLRIGMMQTVVTRSLENVPILQL